MSVNRKMARRLERTDPARRPGDDPPTRFSRAIGAAVERFAQAGGSLGQVRNSLLRYAGQCHMMSKSDDDFAEKAKWALAKEKALLDKQAKSAGEPS